MNVVTEDYYNQKMIHLSACLDDKKNKKQKKFCLPSNLRNECSRDECYLVAEKTKDIKTEFVTIIIALDTVTDILATKAGWETKLLGTI